MADEVTTAAAETEEENGTLTSFLGLLKSLFAVILPLIGLGFLTKYLDEIG